MFINRERVRVVGEPLQGFVSFFIGGTQGSRSSNPGLKLENAFGVGIRFGVKVFGRAPAENEEEDNGKYCDVHQ